jgi:hypothetical protein
MDIINPIVMTTAMLTDTSVAEADATAWSSATAYVVGNTAMYEHHVYECLVNHTNAQPDLNLTGATPKWLDLGATNAYKCLDDKWGTQTTDTTQIVIELTPGKVIDSMALLNLIGTSVNITCTNGATEIYNRTIELQTDIGVYDWYTYFLAPIVAQDDVVVKDLLPYGTQVITITLNGTGTVAIGGIVLGSYVFIGDLLASPSVSITDYSKKDVDAYGNVVVTQRAYSKRFTGRLVIPGVYSDQLAALLASIRATPVVWVGLGTTLSSLIVWGFYKDFEIELAYESISYCRITIEGIA